MNKKQMRLVAIRFGIRFQVNNGACFFFAKGQHRAGAVLLPKTSRVGHRLWGRNWSDGDYADAIAIALTKSDSPDRELVKTIRAVGDLITAGQV